MTTPNQAQTRFLADHGVASVHDFPAGSTNKLVYLELASEPDAAADTDEFTVAQQQWLASYGSDEGRKAALADPFLRSIFDGMGTKPAATATAGDPQTTAKPATPRRPGEWFRLDTDRISGLHPLRKLELQEHVNVLNADRRFAMAGIPPERREATRNHIEEAKAHATAYLAD